MNIFMNSYENNWNKLSRRGFRHYNRTHYALIREPLWRYQRRYTYFTRDLISINLLDLLKFIVLKINNQGSNTNISHRQTKYRKLDIWDHSAKWKRRKKFGLIIYVSWLMQNSWKSNKVSMIMKVWKRKTWFLITGKPAFLPNSPR